MTNQKELALNIALITAAAEANAANEFININVEVNRDRVTITIADPRVVSSEQEWDWLFYPDNFAYFSGDVFPHDLFVERIDGFMAAIKKHAKHGKELQS